MYDEISSVTEMEKANLTCKDFHKNVSKSFRLLKSESYLHDVTLMSEDYFEVSAHKLVLSACSEHFRNIFKKSKGINPMICLNGVRKEELQNLMDYIYYGETKVDKKNLDSFLQVAKRLKLDGVMGDESDKEVVNEEQRREKESFPKTVSKKTTDDSSNNIMHSYKTNPYKGKYEVLTELDQKVETYGLKSVDGRWKCSICGRTVVARQKINFGHHIDACLSGKNVSFDCPSCNETYKSKSGLSTHKTIFH